MKTELKTIYSELAAGKLSKAAAMERIRALKGANTASKTTRLVVPSWHSQSLEGGSVKFAKVVVIDGAELKLSGEGEASRYQSAALDLFARVKALLSEKVAGKTLLQLTLTPQLKMLQGLQGLLRSASLENPDIVTQVILLDETTPANRVLVPEQAWGQTALVRYRGGQREVMGWQDISLDDNSALVSFKEQGTYLITGGLGGIGIEFAKAILTTTSQAKVVLTGRAQSLSADKQALLDSLGHQGRVSYVAMALNDSNSVASVIAGIDDLCGILHSAGMNQDNYVINKTNDEFSAVLEPKVSGSENLVKACAAKNVDFIALFSSVASWLGNVGQADYACANGFMEALCEHQASSQPHLISINWPLWRQGGMNIEQTSLDALEQRTGLSAIESSTGIGAFHFSLLCGEHRTMLLEGKAQTLRTITDIPKAPIAVKKPVAATQAVSGDLVEQTQQWLKLQFSELLKIPAERIDAKAQMENYGIDSILAMNLTAKLEKTLGPLSKTLFFEYLTVSELADYLIASHSDTLNGLFEVKSEAPTRPVRATGRAVRQRVTTHSNKTEPVAIVGLSGRYPGARDLDTYWHNLAEGKDCITEVPKSRWDSDTWYSEDRTEPGKHYSKWGGFIAGVDEFDPRFFSISPKEATTIDPQERLFLQHVWLAIEDAGLTRDSLQIPRNDDQSGQVGVYAGVMYGEYHRSGSLASVANRASYVLNVHGPSMTVDTMCSSSLTAIHLACQDLKSGRTDVGIAGGVNVSVHPGKYLMLSSGQFISSDGHCQSFGEGGDGYIPGEGVGVMVLRRLSDAEREGHHIYGVIKGSALNHGGKTNGYTVPNPQAQASAIAAAVNEAGINPRNISYIEAHGTGTKLGDPIEIAALTKVFYQGVDNDKKEQGFCLIGSAKSNVGHCESAAGIAGVTKVLLQMKHKQVVPSLHSKVLNPHIDFDQTPFIVNQQLTDWQAPQGSPRIAGISSFGAGGANAHVIVEEYAAKAKAQPSKPVAIVLSARTVGQLEQKVADLLRFVQNQADIDLNSMAYTLQVGRESMDERCGFVAKDLNEVKTKLADFAKLNKSSVKRLDTPVSSPKVTQDNLAEVVDAWLFGAPIQWQALYRQKPGLISLPGYPFAQESYWHMPELPQAAQSTKAVETTIHPLLHRNVSDVNGLRFASRFEQPLSDPQYLEMVRVAAEQAYGNDTTLHIADVLWGAVAKVGSDIEVAVLDNGWVEVFSGSDIILQALLSFDEYQPPAKPVEQTAAVKQIIALGQVVIGEQASVAAGPLEKPSSIKLGKPKAFVAGVNKHNDKPKLSLPPVTAATKALKQVAANIELVDLGTGVVELQRIGAQSDVTVTIASVVAALNKAEQLAHAKVVIIKDIHIGSEREQVNLAIEQGLYSALINCTLPTINVLGQNTQGADTLLASCCDFMITPDKATFSFDGLMASPAELELFNERFAGLPKAQNVGAQLDIINQLIDKSVVALKALKPHLNRFLKPLVAALKPYQIDVDAKLEVPVKADFIAAVEQALKGSNKPDDSLKPVTPAIAINSDVVEVKLHDGGIAEIILAERQAKNMFTEALALGLRQAFDAVGNHQGCKVVVVTGFDSYFASGGTLDTLLAIQDGSAQFTDEKTFQLPMDCPLPVIAAMQGHGIGGGWSFGMFADYSIYSQESHFVSPYMNYGFTPGAGSTLVLPKRLGYDLTKLSLLTGLHLTGGELAKRGLTLPVLPRKDVVPEALALAQRLLVLDRQTLVELKQNLTAPLKAELEETYARELAMHDKTFVGSRDTLNQINSKFNNGEQPTVAEPVAQAKATSTQTVSSDQISANLQVLLAGELHLEPNEIEANEQFVDLGLDSITGVTFIRKVNAQYGTDIEATKVYSYPTLRELTDYVVSLIDIAEPAAPSVVETQAVTSTKTVMQSPALSDIMTQLRGMLAKELHLSEDEVGDNEQFVDLGLDSITGVTFVRSINAQYGTDIEATKVYSYPTLVELSEHVQSLAKPQAVEVQQTVEVAQPAPVTPIQQRSVLTSKRSEAKAKPSRTFEANIEPIAIIGMAGQFPMADDVEHFWQNIAEGKNCISEIEPQRWSPEQYFKAGKPTAGKTNSKWLGALDHYDCFDPLFFNISPGEADTMDPQQRLFLQACYHSIEHAGYNPQSLSGSLCGVFVGCATGDYLQVNRNAALSAQGFTGTTSSILAARISYFLNLQGPCVALETACSSSLVAISNACDSLNSGGSDIALAGGSCVLSGPDMHIMCAQAGMLSTDGRCYTFDQRANGFVPGEAVGVLLLKRLSDAEQQGDIIHGVLRGWGINQDGKTNGITAPNEVSQTRLMQQIYQRFDINPQNIGLIEAHGTGTKLGDPIEVAGLKAAFKPYAQETGYCALGSAKSNIGHCLTAAGVSGVIKLVQALKHQQLPPTINFEQQNEHINIDGSPFFINTRLQPWQVKAGQLRHGAVSSFGFGGTNAHLVLSEYVGAANIRSNVTVQRENNKVLVPLSARTEQQLAEKVTQLLRFVDENPQTDIVALSYTLQVGREAMDERLGLMSDSMANLRDQLSEFAAGGKVAGSYRHSVKDNKESMKLLSQDADMRATVIAQYLSQGKLGKLLELWAKGLAMDWLKLYGEQKPQRLVLPVYPFAKERHWIEAENDQGQSKPIHPLLHRNVSILSQQRYQSTFNSGDDCLELGVLPTTAIAEMVKAAVIDATTDIAKPGVNLAEFSIASPLQVQSTLEVNLDLSPTVEGAIEFRLYSQTAEFAHGFAELTDEIAQVEAAVLDDEPAFTMMTPKWEVIDSFKAGAYQSPDNILLIGGDDEQRATVQNAYTSQQVIQIQLEASDSLEIIKGKLQGLSFGHIIWLAQSHEVESYIENSLITDQQVGIMQLFRLTKAMIALGLDKQAIDWTLLTFNSVAVRKDDKVNPTHAALHGFSGSMAKEFRHWQVRLLDVAKLSAQTLSQADSLPIASEGICYANRQGQWFEQKLVEIKQLEQANMPYRENGVYVVIGGAGGIGEVWSEKVVKDHHAQVIWIGRRAEDATITEKLDRIAAIGSRPLYVQADVSSLEQMQNAYTQIKARFPAIHGVIHSAVGAFDDSLKSVSEADFAAILAVKIQGAVYLGQVFNGEPLDFVMGFSSNAAFARQGGMSGYSAGCTFKDAYLQQLGKAFGCVGKVMNWGYWSIGAGDTVSDSFKARFFNSGHRPIESSEGMKALDSLLGSSIGQMSVAKMKPSVKGEMAALDCFTEQYQPTMQAYPDFSQIESQPLPVNFDSLDGKVGAGMEGLLPGLLNAIMSETKGTVPFYDRWCTESFAIAERAGLEAGRNNESAAQMWAKWDEAKIDWMRDDSKKALCQLVETCLRALPEILTGKVKATDVVFPNSSLALVEAVYKTDTVSLAFNECLSDTVVAAVKARLAAEPDAKIRILEIGAGTGSSTVGIIRKLKPIQDSIAEYCYTDLSKAFLFHAEKVYAPDAPYLVTKIFNVEAPIDGQGIDPNRYDFVVAANVLHATKNIRNTMRNSKAVMKVGGAILLNEISDKSIYGHLTFGLLEGWWLNEDDELRIPGSPGLYPELWQSILNEEGFDPVYYPAKAVHHLGQQIVMAVSDGLVHQKQQPKPVAAPVVAPAPVKVVTVPAKVITAPVQAVDIKAKAIDLVKQVIGSVLKMSPSQLDAQEPLETYGIDSIIIGQVNEKLKADFADIDATVLYEHQTIAALAEYLVTTYKDHFAVSETVAQTVPQQSAVQQSVPQQPSFEQLDDKTRQYLKQVIGGALKMNQNQLDVQEPLESYGIDSIIIGQVNEQLKARFEDIDATVLYECQTIAAMADYLKAKFLPQLQQMFGVEQVASTAPAPVAVAPAATKPVNTVVRGRGPLIAQANAGAGQSFNRGPIAIIGISGIYPQAANLDEYWDNLKNGKDCVTEVPGNRWNVEEFYDPDEQRAIDQGKSYSKWGGFVSQFAEFDAFFFGISPREAMDMDPQERLFLQESWRALEDAGITRQSLKDHYQGEVGVFAGITRPGYNLYGSSEAIRKERFRPRSSFSSVANRLSYLLDIHGPSMPVDTMCSSSLTAIHQACAHIERGDCDLAIAGGVNLYVHPLSYVDMASQHMFSKDGRCKSFGEGGNGFVPGEGVGVVILKPQAQAEQDKDAIHGLILASHINHGGKTNGYSVPNPKAQGDLIRRTIDKAGISARAISYIEAHGTGTELGDPIEISGLQQAFGPDSQDTGYCRIGSAKSNIGHCEGAAGIASFTKVLLQLKNKQIVPSLHADVLNPHIQFHKTAFVVNRELTDWRRPVVAGAEQPLTAGVSSFGAGGGNAHVLLQEYQAPTVVKHAKVAEPVAIVLSAKNAEQLQQKVSDLVDFIGRNRTDIDLTQMAYTLQLGREAMDERLAVLADSLDALAEKLSGYLYGEEVISDLYTGRVQRNDAQLTLMREDDDLRGAVNNWLIRRKLSKLLDLWVKGLNVDWTLLYGHDKPGMMGLPTYPFAKDTYWIDSLNLQGQTANTASGHSGDMGAIEDIFNQIENDSISENDAVQLIKSLQD